VRPPPRATEPDHKATVVSLHHDVLARGQWDLLGKIVAPEYRSHLPELEGSPRLFPGDDALTARLRSAGKVPNEICRMIADGDLVYAHVKYPGTPTYAGVDIYRFDAAGRIAEHWSVRQPKPQTSARADAWFSDAAEVGKTVDLDREWAKGRVREMIETVWRPGNAALVPDFYERSYVQHNPDMPGGYERILEVVQTSIRSYIDQSGGPFPVTVHRVGGEGDLVFIHLSIFMAGINRNEGVRSTNVDIFRVNRHGRMTEHWDVLQMQVEPVSRADVLF
jgi:predicted SnoaL-like aldol condensation-catalyzing enzyme